MQQLNAPLAPCDILRNELQLNMQIRVGDIIDKHVVYALKPTASLATCMHMFEEKNVMAAPVYVVEQFHVEDYDEDGYFTGWPEIDTRCVALVNQMDLVHFINSLSFSKQAQLADMRLQEVIDMEDLDRDISIPLKASLYKVMWYMARGHPRVLLADEGQACGVCSMSDVNAFLSESLFSNPPTLGIHTIAQMSMTEANFGKDKFGKVSRSATVESAINFMFKERVAVVAVVDDDTGELIGQFSHRDLRGIGPKFFYRFKWTVMDFLATLSRGSTNPVVVSAQANVAEISGNFANDRLHFQWVVDENKRPLKVVTLGDVMRLAQRPSDFGNSKIQTPRSQWSTIQTPKNATKVDVGDEAQQSDGEGDQPEEQDEVDADMIVEAAAVGFEGNESDDEQLNDAQLEMLAVTEINDTNASVITPREIQEAIWMAVEVDDEARLLPVQTKEEYVAAVNAELDYEDHLKAELDAEVIEMEAEKEQEEFDAQVAELAEADALQAAIEAAEYETEFGPVTEDVEFENRLEAEMEAEARHEFETQMIKALTPRPQEQEIPYEYDPDVDDGGQQLHTHTYNQPGMSSGEAAYEADRLRAELELVEAEEQLLAEEQNILELEMQQREIQLQKEEEMERLQEETIYRAQLEEAEEDAAYAQMLKVEQQATAYEEMLREEDEAEQRAIDEEQAYRAHMAAAAAAEEAYADYDEEGPPSFEDYEPNIRGGVDHEIEFAYDEPVEATPARVQQYNEAVYEMEKERQQTKEAQAAVALSKFEAIYCLLKTSAEMYKAGYISLVEKSFLKNVIVSQEPTVIDSALRFLATNDQEEFWSTLVDLALAQQV